MGWLTALGAALLLGAVPLGLDLKYDHDGPVAKLLLGPVSYLLYPRPKKKPKGKPPKQVKQPEQPPEQKPEETLPKPPQPPKPEAPPQKETGSLTDFLPLVRVGLDMLSGLRRKLRVDLLELNLILAGDDPCDLAVNYGRAWAVLGNLMPNLERFLVIKKRNLEVQCDFTSEKTTLFARMKLTITLGRLLGLALVYGLRGLTTFLNIQNKRKGGATT